MSSGNLKEIITHHLSTTEWKYTQPGGFGMGSGRDDSGRIFADHFGATVQESHPIRVLGGSGGTIGEIEPPDMGPLRNGLGIEGLPMSTR